MHLLKAIFAGVGAGLLGILTSWLVTGVIFHPYQRQSPDTFRGTEGPREYALASGATLIAALIVALFFALTGGVPSIAGSSWLANGAIFGVFCWATVGAPVLLSMGVFVNFHRGVVMGLLLDWLLVSVLAAVASAWAVLG